MGAERAVGLNGHYWKGQRHAVQDCWQRSPNCAQQRPAEDCAKSLERRSKCAGSGPSRADDGQNSPPPSGDRRHKRERQPRPPADQGIDSATSRPSETVAKGQRSLRRKDNTSPPGDRADFFGARDWDRPSDRAFHATRNANSMTSSQTRTSPPRRSNSAHTSPDRRRPPRPKRW